MIWHMSNGEKSYMPKKYPSPKYLFLLFVMLFVILATALRPATKYSEGIPVWISYVVGFLLVFWLLLRFTGKKERQIILGVGLVVYSSLSAFFYPIADAMKDSGEGQDQDDCTILVAKQLFQFDFPYDERSYFGNPCSPLPGAVLPYAPFALTDLFLLANPIIMTVLALLAVKYSTKKESTLLALLLVLGIPQTLELSIAGSDFIFMGYGLLLVVVLLERSEEHVSFLWAGALLASLITSSRVSTPILGVVFIIWLWSKHRDRFFSVGSVFAAAAGLPTILIFLWNPSEFSPLHLVGKGASLVPGSLYILMIVATLASFVFIAVNKGIKENLPAFFALGFSAHLIFLSVGDWVFRRDYEFSTWEGASYLMTLTPLWFLIISRSMDGLISNLYPSHLQSKE